MGMACAAMAIRSFNVRFNRWQKQVRCASGSILNKCLYWCSYTKLFLQNCMADVVYITYLWGVGGWLQWSSLLSLQSAGGTSDQVCCSSCTRQWCKSRGYSQLPQEGFHNIGIHLLPQCQLVTIGRRNTSHNCVLNTHISLVWSFVTDPSCNFSSPFYWPRLVKQSDRKILAHKHNFADYSWNFTIKNKSTYIFCNCEADNREVLVEVELTSTYC